MIKFDLMEVRDYRSSDYEFICATWLRALRYGNRWFELIDSDSYYRAYHKVIDAIMIRPNIKIKVACLKEDTDVILGYTIYADNRLDWVFVKSAWRNIGIARSLVPPTINTVSHITNQGYNIMKKHNNIKFNPFDYN